MAGSLWMCSVLLALSIIIVFFIHALDFLAFYPIVLCEPTLTLINTSYGIPITEENCQKNQSVRKKGVAFAQAWDLSTLCNSLTGNFQEAAFPSFKGSCISYKDQRGNGISKGTTMEVFRLSENLQRQSLPLPTMWSDMAGMCRRFLYPSHEIFKQENRMELLQPRYKRYLGRQAVGQVSSQTKITKSSSGKREKGWCSDRWQRQGKDQNQRRPTTHWATSGAELGARRSTMDECYASTRISACSTSTDFYKMPVSAVAKRRRRCSIQLLQHMAKQKGSSTKHKQPV